MLTKDQRKEIRLRICHLLDNDPNSPEIQVLGKMLSVKTKPDPVKRTRQKEKVFIDPDVYIRLRKEGQTRSEIAEYFGVTFNFLRSEVQKLSVKGILKGKTKASKYERLTIDQYILLSETKTDKEIAEYFGLDRTTITKYKMKWGISEKRIKISLEEYKRLSKVFKTDRQIAQAKGICHTTICRNKRYWKKEGLL